VAEGVQDVEGLLPCQLGTVVVAEPAEGIDQVLWMVNPAKLAAAFPTAGVP
jgi:hypothetical protein